MAAKIDFEKNLEFANAICTGRRVSVEDVKVLKTNLEEAYDIINQLKGFTGDEVYNEVVGEEEETVDEEEI